MAFIGALLVISSALLFLSVSSQNSSDDTMYACGMTTLSSDNDIAVSLAMTDTLAIITLSGPSEYWFGVGFGATTMEDTWTIIVDGNGDATERKLGFHTGGSELTASITTINSTVMDDVRYIAFYRALAGAGSDYYTFEEDSESVNVIWGTSNSATFEAHSAYGSGSITIEDSTDPDCDCTIVENDDCDDSDEASKMYNAILVCYLVAMLFAFSQMV